MRTSKFIRRSPSLREIQHLHRACLELRKRPCTNASSGPASELTHLSNAKDFHGCISRSSCH
jgi:hypothetical protein